METGQASAGIGIGIGTTLNCNHEAPIIAHSLRGEGFDASEDGTGRGTPTLRSDGPVHVAVAFAQNQSGELRLGEVANTLNTNSNASGRNTPMIKASTMVRRLTPRERERLMGMPDDYTFIPWRKGKLPAYEDQVGKLRKPTTHTCPDSPRYKALGNSMAVPVVRWIGERIQMVEDLK